LFDFSLLFSHRYDKHFDKGDWTSSIVFNDKQFQHYAIDFHSKETKATVHFAQLFIHTYNNLDRLYTIIIGKKLYQVCSHDLKHRRLIIVDRTQTTNESNPFDLRTLFSMAEPFLKSIKIHHLTLNDDKLIYGYLALALLINHHECQ
jgi:hypothetical protein